MVVRCPKCETVRRLADDLGQSRIMNFFCLTCQHIVSVDLLRDSVTSTSSADSVEMAERKKILVVDDAATIRKIAGELLTSAGYDVLEAADGGQVLDLVHKERPDLIVLDLVMPKMTGFQVVQEIRKDPRVKEIPILIMSEVISVQGAHDLLHKFGVACFLSKAQMMTSLVSRVQDILSKRAHQAA